MTYTKRSAFWTPDQTHTRESEASAVSDGGHQSGHMASHKYYFTRCTQLPPPTQEDSTATRLLLSRPQIDRAATRRVRADAPAADWAYLASSMTNIRS